MEGKEIPEPLAEEARYFTEIRLLQREVKVVLEGVSGQNLLGTVLHPAGNISELLLESGTRTCSIVLKTNTFARTLTLKAMLALLTGALATSAMAASGDFLLLRSYAVFAQARPRPNWPASVSGQVTVLLSAQRLLTASSLRRFVL